jgi:predicted aspartyl protease
MLGRNLRILGCLIVISMAALPFASAKESPDQPAMKGTVRFNLYQGYLMVAKGSVGSLKGLHFLLDTGTSTTLVDPSIARKLKLEGMPEDVNIIFFDGRTHAEHVHVPGIEFGPIRQDNFRVLVQDLSILSEALQVHIDAIIGLDLLGQSPFEVDYRSKKIYFGKRRHLPISIPLIMDSGVAMVDAKVNHATVHLIFDTGTPRLLVFGSRIQSAIKGLKVRILPQDAGIRGSLRSKAVNLPSLQLGNAEFRKQQAILMDNRDEGGRDFDGVLSPAALGTDAFALNLDSGALELRLGM